MVEGLKDDINSSSNNLHSRLKSQIERITRIFSQTTSSTPNLATFLNNTLIKSNISFSDIENKVAPILFQTLVMTPHLSQISYVGLEGQLIFSYGKDQLNNQTFALHSNSSSSSKTNNNNTWYRQSVDHNTGKLLGDVVKFNPNITTNATWFRELAFKSMNGSYAYLGSKWDNGHDLLLLKSATINNVNKGVIILGFLVKELVDEYYDEVNLVGGSLYLTTKDGQMIVNDEIKGTQLKFNVVVDDHDDNNGNSNVLVSFELVKPNTHIGNVTCHPYIGISSTTRANVINIQGASYNFYCSSLDLIGVQSVSTVLFDQVYVLALPQSGLIKFIHKHIKGQLILLISIMVLTIFLIFYFVLKNFRDAIVENYLRATLIKQMEATKLAQKKNEDQNLAFARASHDIRAPLAGISGLIDFSYKEVAPGSDLETNLRHIDKCTDDLIGIVNTILDTSKIEAGMMQLEEVEFQMAQLLEEVVDLYHSSGAKRKVDLILDPCDASVIKFSHVKGDRIKLKQILGNLLSNAIKCTPEHGHVVLRAWAKKPSSTSSSTINSSSSNRQSLIRLLSCLSYKNKADEEEFDQVMGDPHVMEFVFEVDDTGKGIPKEKQKDLFENYVQDKETYVLKEGTGLGLGIVKSLVQLMHGKISIVDKDIGEKGACFRFNILLSVCEDVFDSNKDELDSNELLSIDIRTPNCSPTLSVLTHQTPKADRSYVILMIHNHERRRVSHKFMKRLGIKVFVVEEWDQLLSTLEKVKCIKYGNNINSDSSNNSSSTSQSPYLGVEATNKDGTNYIRSLFKKTSTNPRLLQRKTGGLVVLVMDVTTAGPISQLSKMVSKFKNSVRDTCCCRVVWLVNSVSSYKSFFEQDDIIMHKPFHGTRLYQVVKLLPEFGGSLSSPKASSSSNASTPSTTHQQVRKVSTKVSSSSNVEFGSTSKGLSSFFRYKTQFQGEIPEEKRKLTKTGSSSSSSSTPSKNQLLPLSEKRILVVDDDFVARALVSRLIIMHGGTTSLCSDGKEAFQLISNELANPLKHGDSMMTLPYDYILMDCEMPIMDGFEATREIRKVEKSYGVHIPIIGLTAHDPNSKEAKKTKQVGMDYCLSKPLKHHDLLKALDSL
ncbi:histidine kinase CKI1 [Cannabis sativa]|uniref:histidine kinase CKI1 n=1 Tax=Cannabis sativa TaxID=3483 RepID=UPI0029C9DF32|nr:histidine kinase CKI1 [Cannabis sativa]